MPTLSDVFREIHRLRRHARDLQAEIDRAPVQLKARQNFAAKQAKLLQDGRDHLHAKETDLKAAHEQLQKYKRQLNTITDQKQFEALKHEIADTEARCGKLEEEILLGLGEVDDQSAAVPALEAGASKSDSDLKSFATDTKTRHEQLSAELKKTLDELKVLEKELPVDVQPEYHRRVASYGADALASVAGGVCSQCHTTASAQVMLQLGMGQYITCTSCYRALYLPE
jgi:predicted  nucleic acid-binding Zn-ribbon protein